jgi:hypothetical protein
VRLLQHSLNLSLGLDLEQVLMRQWPVRLGPLVAERAALGRAFQPPPARHQ